MIAAVEDGESNETERLLDMQNKERNVVLDSCSCGGSGGCEGEGRVVIMVLQIRQPAALGNSLCCYI